MNRQAEEELSIDEKYARDKAIALLSYLLDCVRLGGCSDIEDVFSDPGYPNLSRLIVGNQMLLAYKALQFLAPQVFRAAVDGGLPWTSAHELYEKYLKKAQQAETASELLELQNQMYLDFAHNVVLANHQFSPIVRRCRLYINEHKNEPLSVGHIAEALHISTSYLSHVYKQETGETICDFIRQKKIAEAKLLLKYTSLSLTDIWEKLGFCSQSHFTDIFRKGTSITPLQFRNKYKFRKPVL